MNIKEFYRQSYASLLPPPPKSFHNLPKDEQEELVEWFEHAAKDLHYELNRRAEEKHHIMHSRENFLLLLLFVLTMFYFCVKDFIK